VVTRKGEGYEPASDDPSSFHSSSPFNIENGKFLGREKGPSFSEVFGRSVCRLVAADRRFIALTAAMPEGTGLDAVQKEFPENFFDVGIAEQYMFDFAGGLALGGFRPVLGVYSTFLQRAIDQVIHDAALMRLPLLVGLDRAGLVGGDGPTHQGIYDIPLLQPVPGIVLMAPKDENELQHMVYTASRLDRPAFIRFPKEPGRGVPLDREFRELPLGQGEILRRGGRVLILAVGPLAFRALAAAEKLAGEDGIEATVLNVRFIKPLDRERILALAAAERAGRHRRGRRAARRLRLDRPRRVRECRNPLPVARFGSGRWRRAPGLARGAAGPLRPRCRRHPPERQSLRPRTITDLYVTRNA